MANHDVPGSVAARDFPRDKIISLTRHGVRIVGATQLPGVSGRSYLVEDNGRKRVWTYDEVMKVAERAFETDVSLGRHKRELRELQKRAGGRKRVSHATKTTTKRSDKINIDQLAELFGLPSWERIDELNQQHYWEMAKGAENEEAQLEAECAAQDEVYAQWYDAVERAASELFEQHDLELQPAGKWHPSTYAKTKAERRPHQLKIVPSKSWEDAADKIRRTMSGVGFFSFDTLPEFLKSGPYTARTAVLAHLKTVADYPEVYGSTSARSLYDAVW